MLFLVELSQARSAAAYPEDAADRRQAMRMTLANLELLEVQGGVIAGGHDLVFVADVQALAAVDALIQELPIWPYLEATKITPLVAFAERLTYDTRPRQDA